MKSSGAVFAKKSLILTLLAGGLAFLLSRMLPYNWFSPALPFLFVFFFAVSLISYTLLVRSIGSKISGFVSAFMLVTTVKLLLYITVLLLYSFLNRKDAVAFLLNFFILYLVYTVFEIIQVVRLSGSSS